jgi:hypothetical protein
MIKKSEYYELIASLPMLQGKLHSDFEHMSRITFDKRLSKLKEDDLKMVTDLEDFIIWERNAMENAIDIEFKKKVLELQGKYKNKTFLDIIEFSTQRRLMFGLLRKRKAGLEQAPPAEEFWLFPELRYNIEKFWDQPDFGLKHIGKNLAGFDKFIQEDEALEMENQILQLTWDYCDRASYGHYFDIDFLLIYAIRRSIVERWNIAHTPQDITEKFNTLAMEAINGSTEEENN